MTKNDKVQTKVTIEDVAKQAGVSKTTVSRFINGHFDMMSDKTRRRIQNVIDELAYRPSKIAQNLKSKHTKIIGCVIADITTSFSTYLVKGVSDVCEACDYQVLFVNTNNDPQTEIKGIQSLLDSQVDGLIVNTTGGNDDYLIEISESGIPIIIADRYLEQDGIIDTVTSQNYSSSYECVEYLVGQGYQKIYFIGQSVGNNKTRIIRENAFKDAISKFLDIEIPEEYVIMGDDLNITLEEYFEQLKLKHKEENVALFAVNGMMLLNLTETFLSSHFEIGKDFGLCGFDDWSWARMVQPGITTIRQDTYLTGVECAKHVIAIINQDGETTPQLLELPTELIRRGSTVIQ